MLIFSRFMRYALRVTQSKVIFTWTGCCPQAGNNHNSSSEYCSYSNDAGTKNHCVELFGSRLAWAKGRSTPTGYPRATGELPPTWLFTNKKKCFSIELIARFFRLHFFAWIFFRLTLLLIILISFLLLLIYFNNLVIFIKLFALLFLFNKLQELLVFK